ncbi:MAG: hypothetical protein QME75_10500 [Deltaproteobacteria bacterium]|nr:hypothetical protein [Deltaproteobacteria bacterium]
MWDAPLFQHGGRLGEGCFLLPLLRLKGDGDAADITGSADGGGGLLLVPALLAEGTAKLFWFGILGLDRLYTLLEE